jgi:uncharacterized protein (TIGR00730 family)
MRRLCVFCGSRLGEAEAYRQDAQRLGAALASNGIGLVFGAGHIGLMGVLADAVLQAGGEAIGVIPRALVELELSHKSLSEIHIVETMHQRKAKMAELCDAFAALPGGFGTADELFEMLTWSQLGLHSKPIGLLNTAGFFDPLLAWLDHTVTEGFIPGRHRQMLLAAKTPNELLTMLGFELSTRQPPDRHLVHRNDGLLNPNEPAQPSK